ncbi:MAG: SRPBCC domain-containing protein [Ferruginibacter sp.]
MSIKVLAFDFKPNGKFHYKMEAGGKSMFGQFVYKKIVSPDLIEFINSFTDEKGNIIKAPFDIDFPLEVFNKLTFVEEKKGVTRITLEGHPLNATAAQETTYIDLNESMQQGFNGTFNQLEAYIKTQMQLRQQLKTNSGARTTTYLNFPGNTEEAFMFYREIFKTEFLGEGLQRFGDLPAGEGQPPLTEEHKKLIIHVELPILGGHVLMATDAPESMGFKLNTGSNMHINLEPTTRKETERLFNALAEGGTITMPLQNLSLEAYFGYFGSCTDKFGINWMVNCTEKQFEN